MKCLYCTTELPVDGNTKRITCPKCGSEMDVGPVLYIDGVPHGLQLRADEPPVYGENERYDSPQNY